MGINSKVLFNVVYVPFGGNKLVTTVYAVDHDTEEFLIANPIGDFEWIPMNRCYLYNPDEEEV